MGYPIEFASGVYLYDGHLRNPCIANMLHALSMTAPKTNGLVITITSTWRDAPGSYHSQYKAIDVRTGYNDLSMRGAVVAKNTNEMMDICHKWAWRLRHRLGWEYDVVFGDDKHRDHIHIEHDGKRQFMHWSEDDSDLNSFAERRVRS